MFSKLTTTKNIFEQSRKCLKCVILAVREKWCCVKQQWIDSF